MRRLLLLFIAVAYFVLPVESFAQQPLNPSGPFPFSLTSIFVYPKVYSPYGGNPLYPETLLSVDHPLGLEGHEPEYLNIRWNATYSDGVIRPIRVLCWLGTKDKNCSKEFNAGEEAGCTIVLPAYDYKQLNTVVCNFSSPDFPTLFGLINRSLQPVAFKVSVLPESKKVGETFTWKVDVLNLGVMRSNFTINITSFPPGEVWVNPSFSTSDRIEYGKVASFYPQVSLVVAGEVPLYVYTRAVADPGSCTFNEDCSDTVYGTNKACLNGVCWSKQEIRIKVGSASLPEFDAVGLVQIMLLASLVFIVFLKKKK